MDELEEFCARVLGNGVAAEQAARQAREAGMGDRLQALTAAAAACRAHDEPDETEPPRVGGDTADGRRLSEAVAQELAAASARLPERQREALALRELLGLAHDHIGQVMGIDGSSVAPLLARARLRLRVELRGPGETAADCAERDRALRALSRRQDGEPVDGEETTWLLEHLGSCELCTQAHAAMLEASVCYRAWRTPGSPGPSASVAAGRGAAGA